MKKYIIATLIIVALTIFLSKVFYDYHYKEIPPCVRPVTPVTRIMENIIWGPEDYINYRVKDWLKDNVQNADVYQFECVIESVLTHGTKATEDGSDQLPDLIEEHYLISVSTVDRMVKIEHTSTVEIQDVLSWSHEDTDIVYDYKDATTETYTDEIAYLKIDNDSVSYYDLEDGNYTVHVFEGSATSQAFTKLLTLENTKFLGRGLRNMISFEGRFMVLYSERTVDLSPVYAPFYLMKDQSPINGILTEASLHNNANMQEPREFAFKFILRDPSDLLNLISDVISDAPQQNLYTEYDMPYQQTLKLIFYEDLHAVEAFELPNID